MKVCLKVSQIFFAKGFVSKEEQFSFCLFVCLLFFFFFRTCLIGKIQYEKKKLLKTLNKQVKQKTGMLVNKHLETIHENLLSNRDFWSKHGSVKREGHV